MPKKADQKRLIIETIFLFIIICISLLLWNSPFIFPIKLFVVLLHEISHAITAMISGGQVVTMNINANLSGHCEIDGGNELLIASSGYLGSFIWGWLIFYSGIEPAKGKYIIIAISAIIIFSALAFYSTFFTLVSIAAAAFLIACAFGSKNIYVSFLIKTFGLLSMMYAFFDIKQDLLNGNNHISDATAISLELGISEVWIGLLWLVIISAGIWIAAKIYIRKLSL